MLPQQQDFSIGMDVGVYMFCFLMAQQKTPWEAKDFERFANQLAVMIEQQTGTPAEDFALHVVPVMEQAIKDIGGVK